MRYGGNYSRTSRVIVLVKIKETGPNGPRGLTVRSTWSQGRSFYRSELTIKQRVLNTGTFTCGGVGA